MAGDILVAARGVSLHYDEMLVLDRISLDIHDGEFVALLGPSGSGKSTLLRIITGLMTPTAGEVRYRGESVSGPCPHAAMVFQTFALYPWLTVLENVEIGLKAAGLGLKERRDRAAALIDLIGLDGFEDAYPKELSGGMRQRVGFARALAVAPELLCMDEPFSALDFLTAENLRSELLDLWTDHKIPTRSVLMVTHGVDEAVFMADRIVVLSRNPARVAADLAVQLPRPRNRKHAAFLAMVDLVYKIVAEAAEQGGRPAGARVDPVAEVKDPAAAVGVATAPGVPAPSPTGPRRRFTRLPHAAIGMLSGLLELVADRGGRDDLYRLGSELLMEVDDLLPVTEAGELLQLATVREGDLCLTELGKTFAEADVLERKRIFGEQITRLPLFAVMRRVLEGKRSQTMPREFFTDLVTEDFGEAEAQAQIDSAISWGRYAELFAYDKASEEFYLEVPDAAPEEGAQGETGQV